MGVGKSSVGRMVASMLQMPLVDTDELIEQTAGISISQIFAIEGEQGFRLREKHVVENLRNLNRHIISTGGGLAVQPGNLEELKAHALVICLWASPDVIWERVGHQSHRPLLRGADPHETLRNLLFEREPFYRQADVMVNTERRSVHEVAQHVVHHARLAGL